MVRESSPPETTLASDRGSSPGLAEKRNSAVSAPRRPTRHRPGPAPSSPSPAGSRRSATRKRACSIPRPRSSVWIRRSRRRAAARPSVRERQRAASPAASRRPRHPRLQLRDHFVVPVYLMEGGCDPRAIGGDGLHGVAVLPLQLPDGVEAVVDLAEPVGIEGRAVAQGARAADGVLEIGLGPPSASAGAPNSGSKPASSRSRAPARGAAPRPTGRRRRGGR